MLLIAVKGLIQLENVDQAEPLKSGGELVQEEAQMPSVEINPAAVLAAAAAIPAEQPVIMINLLRYRRQAEYGAGVELPPCTGREAYYERYAPVASRLIAEEGARVFWLGSVLATVIGPEDESWDDALLVEYPSFAVLQRLFAHPEYRAVVFHRTAALADSRLIAAKTSSGIG